MIGYITYMIYVWSICGFGYVSGMISINEMGGYITGLVYAHNNQPYCYDDGERNWFNNILE